MGAIMGPTILPGLFYDAMKTTFTLPEWKPQIPLSILWMSVLSVAGSTLTLAAILLAVVVLYNLGVLSYTERHRELCTLKVIGFRTRKIRAILLTQNIWMTTIGAFLGIPAGLWILEYILYYMGDTLDFVSHVRILSYIFSIFITFLVSILVNRLFSRRVRKLDMVSALKGVE